MLVMFVRGRPEWLRHVDKMQEVNWGRRTEDNKKKKNIKNK